MDAPACDGVLASNPRTAMQVDWQDAQADVIVFVRSEAAGMVTGKQGAATRFPQRSKLPSTDLCYADFRNSVD